MSSSSSTNSDQKKKPPSPPPHTRLPKEPKVRLKTVATSRGPRPERLKKAPKRFDTGIDQMKTRGASISSSPDASKGKDIPPSPAPKAKGISIKEPEQTQPTKRKEPAGKGKEKEVLPEKPPKAKKSKTSSVPAQGQASGTSTIEDSLLAQYPIAEINNSLAIPDGFTTATPSIPESRHSDFNTLYGKREFCPFISVNFDRLRIVCRFDLLPYLGNFASFMSITAPYTKNLVKLFYFNMVEDNVTDNEGNVLEERITTVINERRITLSISLINRILRISNPPIIPTQTYTYKEISATLFPDEPLPIGELMNIVSSPMSMSPILRVLWYLYARNLVQKGGNYSHFTQRDYTAFMYLVKQVPINPGHWIFQEIVRFRFGSRRTSYIPFGPFISVILFYHKIWPFGSTNNLEPTHEFGPSHLNYMHLNLDEDAEEVEDSDTSRAHLQTPPKSTKVHKAQSTAPQQVPTDFDSRVKAIVDAALVQVHSDLGKVVAEMKQQTAESRYAQHEITRQLAHLTEKTAEDSEVNQGQFTLLNSSISSLIAINGAVMDKLDHILQLVKPNPPPPSPHSTRPDQSTSSSPSFQFNTPPVQPSSSPSTPQTEPFPHDTPSTPPTEPFPTPNQVLDPTIPLSVRTPPPTPIINLDDVKGGEKQEKNQD